MTKPITERLPELRRAKGWSRERLSREAFRIDPAGTSSQHIASIELGRRPPSARTMATLAEALGVEPTEFDEYRLALARFVLDEGCVGLDRAWETLRSAGLESIDVPPEELIEPPAARRRPARDPGPHGEPST